MAETKYGRHIATAKRLIAQKGQAVTWREPADATPDPDKPWRSTPNAATDHVVNVVTLPDNSARFAALVGGTDVPEGTQLAYMGAVDFEPTVRGTLIIAGKAYRVTYLSPLAPDGTPIIWIVGLAA